jgi:DNA-binding response OmpR family regulator
MKDLSVLVVDDDMAQRVFLTFDLERFHVVEAGGVEEGYTVALQAEPDVVMVDRRLPDGDGLDLVRRLRRHPRHGRTPIAVVTAGYEEADRVAVIKAGADLYLTKPLEAGALEDRICEILGMDPAGRRPRRQDEISRIRSGEAVDEPVIDLTEPKPSRRFWRRRHAEVT